MDCLFCKIIAGDIPSAKVYEDDKVFAFRDIEPQAPVHILIIPKTHISSVNDINDENCSVVGHIFKVAAELMIVCTIIIFNVAICILINNF